MDMLERSDEGLVSAVPPNQAEASLGSMPTSMGFKLRRLQVAYRRMFAQMVGSDGIPANQVGALSLINRNPGITPGELATMLTIDAAHLTAITKQLQLRGFIRRKKSTTDSRSHSLFTTAKGSVEFLRVQEVIAKVEQIFVYSVLQEDEIRQLSGLLDRLLIATRDRDHQSGS